MLTRAAKLLMLSTFVLFLLFFPVKDLTADEELELQVRPMFYNSRDKILTLSVTFTLAEDPLGEKKFIFYIPQIAENTPEEPVLNLNEYEMFSFSMDTKKASQIVRIQLREPLPPGFRFLIPPPEPVINDKPLYVKAEPPEGEWEEEKAEVNLSVFTHPIEEPVTWEAVWSQSTDTPGPEAGWTELAETSVNMEQEDSGTWYLHVKAQKTGVPQINKYFGPYQVGADYTLTVESTAGGEVTDPGEGEFTYSFEDEVSLTAVPDTGYHFTEWTVTGGHEANFAEIGEAVTTFTMPDEDVTVTANFSINEYTLTYNSGAGGSIVGESPQTVEHGEDGTEVTAVPDVGYHFVEWSDGVLIASRTDTNVTEDITVEAIFSINEYTLTYNAGANGSIVGDTPQTVEHGSAGTEVTASPDVGYHFVEWSDGVDTPSRTDTNVTEDITVEAIFAINEYTLTYNAGAGGSVVGDTPQTVNHGSDGTEVTASPDAGYHFAEWSDGVLTASRTDENVTEDITVTANFAINEYTVTFKDWDDEVLKTETVEHGSAATAPADPVRPNHRFTGWDPADFSNITADLTVTAQYIRQHTVTFRDRGVNVREGIARWHFDEGEGGTAFDSIDSHDGTINNAAWVQGISGTALEFNGTDSYVSVHDHHDLNPTGELTLAAWVKWGIDPAESAAEWASIINKNVDSQYRLHHNRHNTAFEFAIRTSEGGRWVASDTVPVADTWYFVVGTYDGEQLRIYVDGVLENSAAHSGPINTSGANVNIGRRTSNDRFFTGVIDEISILDVALSPEEIEALFLEYDDSAVIKVEIVDDGGDATAPPDPSLTGYTFTGWDPDDFTGVTEDMIVTAVYSVNQYTITFNSAGGSAVAPITRDYLSVITPPADPTREGYTFTGWDPEVPKMMPAEDITLTAQWALNQYTLTYTPGANGSIVGDTPQTVNHGSDGTEVTAVPDAGYHFVEWSDGVLTASRTDTNVTENINVTAVFSQTTISFADNGGDWSKSHSTTVTINAGSSQITSYYQWTQSQTPFPVEENWTSFTSPEVVNAPSGETGSFFLHIKATDQINPEHEIQATSEAFKLDNTLPEISFRNEIIIDSDKIDEELTDFPVLVKLDEDNFDFSKSREDGYDVFFTEDDGSTLLDFERVTHDAGDEFAEYWVKIPSVSEDDDTVFYLHYGNLAAEEDKANPEDVWDENFIGVWHKDDGPGNSFVDSTANDNYVNKQSADQPLEINGIIGKAQQYNGNYASAAANESLDEITDGITISGWYRPDGSNPGFMYLLSKNTNDSWQMQYGLLIRNPASGGDWGVILNSDDERVFSRTWTTGEWYYLTITWDGSTVNAYVNGESEGSTAHTGMSVQGDYFNIGARREGAGYAGQFQGGMDEVRLSDKARSAAWIKACYHSGNNSLLQYSNFVWSQTPDTTAVTVTDEHSGVDISEYQWTASSDFPAGGTWEEFDSDDPISTLTGNYYLHVKVTDEAGNTREATSNLFRVDKEAPVHVSHSLSGNQYTDGNEYWVKPGTELEVILRGRDDDSGLRRSYIRLYGEEAGVDARSAHYWNEDENHNHHWVTDDEVTVTSAFRSYSGPPGGTGEVTWGILPELPEAPNEPGDGTRTLSYKVQYRYNDNAMNEGGYHNTGMIIRVDDTAPDPPELNLDDSWAAESRSFTISGGSDDHSGFSHNEYRTRLNEGAWSDWTEYESEVTIEDHGITDVQARSVDNVGNVSSTVSGQARIGIYTITVTSEDSNRGTVRIDSEGSWAASNSKQVNYGDSVTINANPASGWNFRDWREDGTTISTNANHVVNNITGNRSFTARFEEQSCCPFIYSFDGEQYYFEHESIPFAISRLLERYSYGSLHRLQEIQGSYHIRVTEELDEISYVNKVRLWEVDYPADEELHGLYTDIFGKPHTVKEIILPDSFVDNSGTDHIDKLKKDGVFVKTINDDFINFEEMILNIRQGDSMESYVAEFSLPGEVSDEARLIIRFQKNDTYSFDQSYENIAAAEVGWLMEDLDFLFDSEEVFKKGYQWSCLRVEVWNGEEWMEKGATTAGNHLMEEFVFPVNMPDTDKLKVRVSFLPSFYEIDLLGIDYSDNKVIAYREVDMESAVFNEENDITELLTASGKRQRMVNGDHIDLFYKSTPRDGNIERGYFVGLKGYYYMDSGHRESPFKKESSFFDKVADVLKTTYKAIERAPDLWAFYQALSQSGCPGETIQQQAAGDFPANRSVYYTLIIFGTFVFFKSRRYFTRLR